MSRPNSEVQIHEQRNFRHHTKFRTGEHLAAINYLNFISRPVDILAHPDFNDHVSVVLGPRRCDPESDNLPANHFYCCDQDWLVTWTMIVWLRSLIQ